MMAARVTRGLRRIPHLLRPSGLAALRSLAPRRTLLVFDFDGTLAPIADRPQMARMSARTRKLLAAVARLYPCAVISGRARQDLVRLLGRIPVIAIAGSHGAESHGGEADAPHSRVGSWARHLRRRLGGLRGVVLEVKPHGVAVHYREAEDKRQARATILAVVTDLEDARHIHGKMVVEVLAVESPNKGDALAAIRRRLQPRATLYIGDDVTDEDAFSSRGPGGLLPVRIGHADATAALFGLDEQGEVEMVLHALLELALRGQRAARVSGVR